MRTRIRRARTGRRYRSWGLGSGAAQAVRGDRSPDRPFRSGSSSPTSRRPNAAGTSFAVSSCTAARCGTRTRRHRNRFSIRLINSVTRCRGSASLRRPRSPAESTERDSWFSGPGPSSSPRSRPRGEGPSTRWRARSGTSGHQGTHGRRRRPVGRQACLVAVHDTASIVRLLEGLGWSESAGGSGPTTTMAPEMARVAMGRRAKSGSKCGSRSTMPGFHDVKGRRM
jgi:hypothetical protein